MTSPAGIDCGVACSGSYAAGTVVTLTATRPPDPASPAGAATASARATRHHERRPLGQRGTCTRPGPFAALDRDDGRRVQHDERHGRQRGSGDHSPGGCRRPPSAPRRRGRPLLPSPARPSLALSEAATVTFRVVQPTPGRQVAGQCRRPTARNADRPRCSRWTPSAAAPCEACQRDGPRCAIAAGSPAARYGRAVTDC